MSGLQTERTKSDVANQKERFVAGHRWLSLWRGYRDEPYLVSSDGVSVVAVNQAGEVLLINEPTVFDKQSVLMLPGGSVEEGEAPEISANRELQEEIGYQATRLDLLHCLYPLRRHGNWRVYIYLARDLRESALVGDEGYDLPLTRVPLANFEQLLASNQLQDATTIAALYMARSFIASQAHMSGKV